MIGVSQSPLSDDPKPRPKPRCASSSRIRISSGTAIVGCVSLSWMATLSGSALQSRLFARKPADEIGKRAGDEKILLHKAQSLTLVVRSSGYSTRVSDSALSVSSQRADEIAAAEFLESQNNLAPLPPRAAAY